MPCHWDSVTGKITRSLMSPYGAKVSSISSPSAPHYTISYYRACGKTRCRIHHHIAIRRNRAGAEGQRRNMTFADRAEAEDEPAPALRRAGLVRMGNDAGIEERGRFKRVFVKKIGPDQLALYHAETSMARKGFLHLVGARLEYRQQVAMPSLEILQNLCQLIGGCPGVQRQTRSTMWFARVLSVGLRSRGSVAGLNGRTITLAGSGRRYRACRFRNWICDKLSSGPQLAFASAEDGCGRNFARIDPIRLARQISVKSPGDKTRRTRPPRFSFARSG